MDLYKPKARRWLSRGDAKWIEGGGGGIRYALGQRVGAAGSILENLTHMLATKSTFHFA